MGESLTARHRVREEALRSVNRCGRGRSPEHSGLTVLYKKGAANCVPEASVIRGPQTLSGFTGRKGSCRLPDKFSFKY